ncbi:MAG: CRISPR-associated protein Csa3 [Thermococcaceae archaeon]|uniref:CRISPR-associated CARF protein Csa3 n=1 Tax=Thermococcus TaxID=2263 RepID=UPI0005B2D08E|nr:MULTISPECIES: CRISPR-associated CARF protein Csa3 [Thermococcus]KUK00084.1 MAG: Transcriptional regulator [Thermococcales archaeon 44_46]MDK2783248.1 CRISPR-associated protein Csa3 [Thermococcaceae archaeon]MCA6214831.1 CRISPR locus-related DNA-binding protein [Thermococcus bergensis]MDK2853927.1 CRISPR-associated protein Csa3 [Thermococcaceae archaeon]MDK2982905.1 CRISPR-associated protein Csa3 [Thermococcaceae archaeon]
MLVIFPVGFDEKFIIRALVRKREGVDGLGPGDRLLAVVPEGYGKEERAVNAINSIKAIASPITGEDNVKILEVPPDGEDMVLKIAQAVRENLTTDRIVLAVLSGGMRPILVSTLLALLSVRDARVIVESDFENLSGHISLELGAFLAPPKRRWVMILCGLLKGWSVRKIAEDLGVSPATISNELKGILRYNLARAVTPNDRTPKYAVTEAGKLYLRLWGEGCHET